MAAGACAPSEDDGDKTAASAAGKAKDATRSADEVVASNAVDDGDAKEEAGEDEGAG